MPTPKNRIALVVSIAAYCMAASFINSLKLPLVAAPVDMTTWMFIFWISLFLLWYSYLGYGICLYALLKVLRLLGVKKKVLPADFEPPVTFMVAAYNESGFIREKILNTLSLNYPADKLHLIFVTDGSTDDTNAIISGYPQVQLMYEPGRNGKTMAINRAMQQVKTDFVIFSDANTLLNDNAIRALVSHFADARTGAVAGEKKVLDAGESDAEGAGEGMYWKYESLLKKWDAELYSVMGAAGELFAIRTSLYESVPASVILDDFIISFRINRKGYTVGYEPGAYAMETGSASLKEEYKRKVRISAGGFQSMGMLADLLNFFRYPKITWQYMSHRVLRWTLAPLSLPLLLVSGIVLSIAGAGWLYILITLMQLGFYAAAATGYVLAARGVKVKYFYIPFYFLFMNWAVYAGFLRFIRGKQSAIWERSDRKMAKAVN